MNPSTREEAIRVGARYFLTGKPCRNGHMERRSVANGDCLQCRRDISRKHFKKNGDAIREAQREKWKNPQFKKKRSEERKKWYGKYEGKLNEVAAIYRRTVSGRVSMMLADARHRSKKIGVISDLDREWIMERLNAGGCELTGIPFQFGLSCDSKTNPFGPTIDRKIPHLGYIKSNCRIVIWGINMAMADFGEEVYAKIASAFLERRFMKEVK